MSADTESRQNEVRSHNAAACPVIQAIDQVGTPWRLNVIFALQEGELRFNELKRETNARSRTLSQTLETLGDNGLVERRMEEASPVAVYYSLTEKAQALQPVFDEFEQWADEWLDSDRGLETINRTEEEIS